jgi:hypothetical protein
MSMLMTSPAYGWSTSMVPPRLMSRCCAPDDHWPTDSSRSILQYIRPESTPKFVFRTLSTETIGPLPDYGCDVDVPRYRHARPKRCCQFNWGRPPILNVDPICLVLRSDKVPTYPRRAPLTNRPRLDYSVVARRDSFDRCLRSSMSGKCQDRL